MTKKNKFAKQPLARSARAQDQPEDLTTPEILPPTNDWIFKLLFGDERHKDNLINLLKSFIELPQEEYELIFLDTHLKPEFKKDKLGILDVKVKTKSGRIINIEIQVDPFKDIGKRISFYKSKLIVGQIAESQEYDAIQDVICICIFKKAIFPEVKEYMNHFQFMNPANGLLFAGIPEIVYTAEIEKIPIESDGSAAWEWLRFFRSRSKEEFEMIAQKNPEIRQTADTLYTLSADEATRAEYEAQLKARRDLHAKVAYAYDDGLAKGIEKGIEKGREEGLSKGREEGLSKGREEGLSKGREEGLSKGREEGLSRGREEGLSKGRAEGREALMETARNALAKGMPLELVQDITGLDMETLHNLAGQPE